jgi:hypothetical protein
MAEVIKLIIINSFSRFDKGATIHQSGQICFG